MKWLPTLRDPRPPRLWRIGYALAVCFAAVVAGLAALWWIAQALLHHPRLPHSKAISVHDTIGVAQLVFASVAGAGALVALVMAYRRQRVAETSAALDRERWQGTAAHDRTRLLNERFTAIAAQLGHDQPAVQFAGVHAMAGLADDWAENRQTCIDVLCAYLRIPYERDPGQDAPAAERLAFLGSREVRHTVIRVITAHLRDGPVAALTDGSVRAACLPRRQPPLAASTPVPPRAGGSVSWRAPGLRDCCNGGLAARCSGCGH